MLLGGGPLTEQIGTFAKRLTDTIFIYGGEPTLATEWIPGHGPKIKAVVYDASHLVQADQFKQLREFSSR